MAKRLPSGRMLHEALHRSATRKGDAFHPLTRVHSLIIADDAVQECVSAGSSLTPRAPSPTVGARRSEGSSGNGFAHQTQTFQTLLSMYQFTLGHKKASTLEGLTEKIGVGSRALVSTVEAYHQGVRSGAGLAAYVGSKHAVRGLARQLALELAPHSIRVFGVPHPSRYRSARPGSSTRAMRVIASISNGRGIA